MNNNQSIQKSEINDPRLNRFKNRNIESVDSRRSSNRHHTEDTDDQPRRGDTSINNSTDSGSSNSTGGRSKRVIHKTEILTSDNQNISTQDEKVIKHEINNNNNVEDDDDGDDRRKRAREKYLLKKKQEEEEKDKHLAMLPDEEADEDEEEGSSEYETDEEEEEEEEWDDTLPKLSLTFVKKEERGTIKSDEQFTKEEEEEFLKKEIEAEKKKQEAHRKLKEELDRDRKDQEIEEQEKLDNNDDDYGIDGESVEYERWFQRELLRVREEICQELQLDFDRLELERRRKMTDEEIAEEDKDRLTRQPKQKLKFMQKDYHRGAFFQDDEYIKNKDFSAPTGSDLFNRESLPQILQVKNFGKSGRTKYTHLADQDTSSKDSLYYQSQFQNKNNHNKYR
ncbi:microfibrillar-associated protein 1-like protein [Tieghemostelium lacteum]|uniref:Microfibrillar-associated protein 1-like protein n=1 Tax=Tieghemostelium lacteum TaxID=361077 RepID=A0A151ZD95_TIELA|nr:microfibrillar-associated protein 1-like protein [Tieghemostelium lacteum]|eukprot:KYQ91928.1 microfibrillar-associated protein 1-like protein [Tieghemostelium lacteum]